MLIRYRHTEPFNSVFFRLTLVVGLFDIAAAVHSNLCVGLPEYGIVPERFLEPLVMFALGVC